MLASLASVALLAAAWAAGPVNDGELFARGRALAEDYLARQGREYGVDLRPDPNTWAMTHPYPDLVIDAFSGQGSGALPRERDLVTAGCREITVNVPARGARARVYVVGGEGHPPEYRLVGTCRTERDPNPRLYLDPISTAGRRFAKREFAARAQPLLQNFFAASAGRVDWSSVRVRRGRGWLIDLLASPVDDCRALDVRVEGRRRRVFVAVRTDQPDFAPEIPLNLQNIFRDPVTLRTYRFAVVRGCAGADQRVAPTAP